MEKDNKRYIEYVKILKAELVPAMGCTEPTSLAFGAAKAREVLGKEPTKIRVFVSGNIIKNVKSVIVPHTNGMRGIKAAVLAGALYGNSEKGLEVISSMTRENSDKLMETIDDFDIEVSPLESIHLLDFIIIASDKKDEVKVRVWDSHTNIVFISKNDVVLYKAKDENVCNDLNELDYSLLNVKDIFEFANTVDLDDVKDILLCQEKYNMKISEEGMRHVYGARIGRILLGEEHSPKLCAKAYAAAASDARMGGCDMPVVINSGSGNQGITASIPVIIYAREYGKNDDEKLRALVISNLVTLHLKAGIGRLSAYCGVVSAGAGAGAGIAYLLTKKLDAINHTIVNALGITSGIVCDGAKSSCAAKIALSVESGIFGFEMYMRGSELLGGEGLVSKGVEKTIKNINELGHDGMLETDKKIIEIMSEE